MQCPEDESCEIDCRTLVEIFVDAEAEEEECRPGDHALVKRCYGMRCMWCPKKISSAPGSR